MDTLSFILGIASVVVTAAAVVAVYAFVKVRKIEKEMEGVYREIESTRTNLYRDLTDVREGICRIIDDRHDSLVRIMDSRLDKLQNKKQLLKD